MKLAIIGHFDPAKNSHTATNDALAHATHYAGIPLDVTWIHTQNIMVTLRLLSENTIHS